MITVSHKHALFNTEDRRRTGGDRATSAAVARWLGAGEDML